MCGGVIFPYYNRFNEALAASYTVAELQQFEKAGQVRSVFWQRGEPILPIQTDLGEEDGSTGLTLMRWGNRDKALSFPQTGWARIDSIEAGKWDYLKPRPVLIPVLYGVEKGKWFPIEQGIMGVIVQKNSQQRVYMLTSDATPDFRSTTGHDRMPVLQGQRSFDWLPADPWSATVGTYSAN